RRVQTPGRGLGVVAQYQQVAGGARPAHVDPGGVGDVAVEEAGAVEHAALQVHRRGDDPAAAERGAAGRLLVEGHGAAGRDQVLRVVELISPLNKDRAASRRAFAANGAAYLQRGVGVVSVDIVTNRQFNLHNELVELLGLGELFRMPAEATLYATAYRPAQRQGSSEIDV